MVIIMIIGTRTATPTVMPVVVLVVVVIPSFSFCDTRSHGNGDWL